MLQHVAVRIDLAFQAFFRRVKAGEKPGSPRFRGKGRYDSITYPQVPAGTSRYPSAANWTRRRGAFGCMAWAR